jgi:peroxiredoxin
VVRRHVDRVYGAHMALSPGDKAPAISLTDQTQSTVKLSSFKGRKVLVFFYPEETRS